MGQRLAALVVVLAVGVSLPAFAADPTDKANVVQLVLATFEGNRGQTIDAFLAEIRPDPLDEASRQKVLASLPPQGEVVPSRKDREKLQGVERILDYSVRRGAIGLKVIDLDYAFVGLYYRTVVLVSSPALRLLSADELAALVAHEVGHDDDWNDYWGAMQAHDSVHMQALELRADGIAVLTLERLGIDPECLVSAIQKMMHKNGWRDSAAVGTGSDGRGMLNADRYVPVPDRIAFIREVARLSWAVAKPPNQCDPPIQAAQVSRRP